MPRGYLPAPIEGMDTSVPAHLLPQTKAPYLRNFLVHGDRLPIRGPIRHSVNISGALQTGGVAMADEGWMFPVWTGQYLIMRTFGRDGLPAASGFSVRWWPWEAFEAPHPALNTTEVPAHGRPVYYNPTSGALTNGAVGAESAPQAFGPHQAQYNDNIYALTTGNTQGLYLQYPAGSGRFHPMTILARYGTIPGTATLGPLPRGGVYLEAPRFGQGLATFANRLWILGGIPSSPSATVDTTAGVEITGPTGGTSARVLKPNGLWYTNIGLTVDPLTDGAWRTSGVSNNFVVGSEGPSDYGMGLTAASKFMVIHKKRSTWVLTGSGLDSFAIKQISATVGLVDPRARVAVADVVYWVSPEGLHSYDGSEVRLLSEPVNVDLRINLASNATNSHTGDAPFTHLAALPNNYLLLQTGGHKLYSSASDSTDQCWLYHIPTERWTVFHTDLNAITTVGSPTGVAAAGSKYFQITTQSVLDASYITDPLSASYDIRGFDRDAAAANIGFPAECYFPPVRLAAPWDRATIQTYGVEAVQEFDSTTNVGNLNARLMRYVRRSTFGQEPQVGGTDTDITSYVDLVGGVVWQNNTPQFLPALSAFTVNAEVTDVQVRVARGADTPPFSAATWMEVVGAYLDWQSSHRRA